MDGSTGNHLTGDISSVIICKSIKVHMYTFLPGLLSLCFNTIVLCESTPNEGTKYYASGKSCYVNGVFYKRCENIDD